MFGPERDRLGQIKRNKAARWLKKNTKIQYFTDALDYVKKAENALSKAKKTVNIGNVQKEARKLFLAEKKKRKEKNDGGDTDPDELEDE